MKRYLEFTNASTAIFWQIEIQDAHLDFVKEFKITSGRIGTKGYEESHCFDTVKALHENFEKRVKEKLESGYVAPNVNETDEVVLSWFERLKDKTFDIYKAAILDYPKKSYKYIQLRWTGQGFALGLSTDVTTKDHAYVNNGDWHNEEEASVAEVYRRVEEMPYEMYDEADDCDYELEFERETWPKNEIDCSHLEHFLIYVGLGLTLLKLQKDDAVKPYLDAVTHTVIHSVNTELYIYKAPVLDDSSIKNILNVFVEDREEQVLINTLWRKDMRALTAYFNMQFVGQLEP